MIIVSQIRHFKTFQLSGVIKIVEEEICYDFQLNNSESIIIGTDREEVLARIQRGFEYQYIAYGRIKNEDVGVLDYTMQAWKRLQKHIKILIDE